jgi:hypothetical protein
MTIKIYGDQTFRGVCAQESAEQIMFLKWLKVHHPHLAAIAFHVRNEGKRTYQQARRELEEGLNKGAPDLVIPCARPILIELKRRDKTKSRIGKEQKIYLENAQRLGAHVGVCLGNLGAQQMIAEVLNARS